MQNWPWLAERIRRTRNLLHLGFLLFMRDFQYRFKLTYLGYTWAGLRPLLAGVPLILVGSQFNFGASADLGMSYPLFAFVGLMLWQSFWDGLFYPQWVMRRSRKILTRVRFPYKAVLAASGYYVMFNIIVYSAMIGVALIIFGAHPGPEILLGLVSLPLLMVSGMAIGTLLAPFVLVYLDLRYGLPLIASVALWSVPAIYVTPETGPLHIINTWNPITYLVNTPRAWLTGGGTPEPALFFAALGIFAVISMLSIRFYERTLEIAVDQVL